MYTLSLFVLQLVLSFIVSGVLLMLLRPVLYDILLGACGTSPRASFWLRFTQINLVIAPLLLVAFFAPVTEATLPEPAQLFRDTLFRALTGSFIGVLVVGHVIWRSVKAELAAPPKQTTATTPAAV